MAESIIEMLLSIPANIGTHINDDIISKFEPQGSLMKSFKEATYGGSASNRGDGEYSKYTKNIPRKLAKNHQDKVEQKNKNGFNNPAELKKLQNLMAVGQLASLASLAKGGLGEGVLSEFADMLKGADSSSLIDKNGKNSVPRNTLPSSVLNGAMDNASLQAIRNAILEALNGIKNTDPRDIKAIGENVGMASGLVLDSNGAPMKAKLKEYQYKNEMGGITSGLTTEENAYDGKPVFKTEVVKDEHGKIIMRGTTGVSANGLRTTDYSTERVDEYGNGIGAFNHHVLTNAMSESKQLLSESYDTSPDFDSDSHIQIFKDDYLEHAKQPTSIYDIAKGHPATSNALLAEAQKSNKSRGLTQMDVIPPNVSNTVPINSMNNDVNRIRNTSLSNNEMRTPTENPGMRVVKQTNAPNKSPENNYGKTSQRTGRNVDDLNKQHMRIQPKVNQQSSEIQTARTVPRPTLSKGPERQSDLPLRRPVKKITK